MSKYTEEEVEQLVELVRELLQMNEELNAKCIAFDAKLKNEEGKVRMLQYKLNTLTMMIYNAENN